MAPGNSNSTMEMGTSDQVLVDTKRKTTLRYVIGGVAMVVTIGVVIALIVVFTGGDGAAVEPIVSTTEGPSSPITPTSTDAPAPTPVPTTTVTPTSAPPTGDELLDLDDIIEGAFSPPSFNGSWSSGNEVLFRNLNGDLVLYDVDTDTSTALIQNTSQVLQQSSRVMTMSPDGTRVVLAYSVTPIYRYSFLARYTAVDIATGNETDIVPEGLATEEAFLQNFVWGPLGSAFAYVYLNNIYYQASLTTPARQITTNGQLNVIYNGIPDWVYEEEVFGSNNAMWFSNDGNKLAYVTFNDNDVRVMRVPHFGVPGSVNYQYTHHHEIRYPKSGTVNPTVSVTLYDLATNTSNVYQAPTDLEQPILKTVRFVNNNAIAVMWTNRVQTTLRVVLCTAGTATCTQIYSYTEADGWIDNIPLKFNTAGNSFVTILPQLVDRVLYKQIVQVTQGTGTAAWTAINRVNTPHTVLEILHWSSTDDIWYKATSVSDSAEQHIYSVNANREVNCFTCNIHKENGEACEYNEGIISKNGARIIINCAGPGVPQVFIYKTDGTPVRLWDGANELNSNLANRAIPTTIRMTVPLISGAAYADVHLQVPANYQKLNNMPLLVYVYGGPDTALVTKQWNIDWGSSLVSRWNIAVAHIDGRGSGLRGVSNMFAINRKLGTVEIQDQISVTKYLQDNLPWIDSNRTCIWGWSYGGYAASKALAEGGDVFRCAAAVAPVVDWKFYDTIYTERYMDLPTTNAEGYSVSSLLKKEVADAYHNKSYFLIHGTADDNVHYQHAMLFSRLLQENDVYFTQMSYTDEDHGLIGVRPHLYHALEKFLMENMM